MLRLIALAATLVVAGTSAAIAASFPHCAGFVEIEHATVERVEKNGVLILRDGRAVHLEAIRLPGGAADHAPQFLADQALATLSGLSVGRALTLTAVPPKEDRYDRVRAQVFDGNTWVQLEMLRRGLARVNIAADRVECASDLYDAEAQARNAHAGLWSSSAYAIRSVSSVTSDVGTFQLVEGTVISAEIRDGRAWLGFGTGLKGDFAAVIASDDLRTYRSMGVNPRGYAGKTVLVRGIVQNLSGPVIAVANPVQVQVIAQP
jgi:endonuclease YncB( thermonuclease family)